MAEGDQASTAGNAKEKTGMKKITSSLNVGGSLFCVDQKDVDSLQSDFLSALLNPDSDFSKPPDGVYTILERDAASFSAILHFSRFGGLPSFYDQEKVAKLLVEADFWGIKERIQKALSIEKQTCANRIECVVGRRCVVDRRQQISDELYSAKRHHNFRDHDFRGRVYCFDCGNRDMDSRFREGDRYTSCDRCQKEIRFKPDLDWCHKCKMCTSCQNLVCPNDNPVRNGHYNNKPSTEELQVEYDCLCKEPMHKFP